MRDQTGEMHRPKADRPSADRAQTLKGVRYLTEGLIEKIGGSADVSQITSLNLALAKEGGKKIKFIENLERCARLQSLNLSYNMIEKIEKLDRLTKLKELNLSYNNIARIEKLEALVNLQALNLTGNNIAQIPNWLPKKLKALQMFRLSKNNIQSLHELMKLKQLGDLSLLAVAENPVSQLAHSRLYLVFHIRTLESLDGQPVSWNERTTAHARFAQEELETLEEQLEKKDDEMLRLKDALDQSAHDMDDSLAKNKAYVDKVKSTLQKIKDLETELRTKDDLLKRKTSELTKACEKHYELEQELAFYKIDHKFEQLARVPSVDDESVEDGLIGESPYIGKGRFRQQILSNQRGEHGAQPDLQKQHELLDRELQEKRQSVDTAQHRLQNLQDELSTTEKQIAIATKELQNLNDVRPSRHLTEDDKQDIRSSIARKIEKVNVLKGDADNIEFEMQQTRFEMEHQEKEIGRLRAQLKRMSTKDSRYKKVEKEMADAEVQLELSSQEYNALHKKLEDMLATIAKEAKNIRKLEKELKEGQAVQNDEIREELQEVITGLQGYLSQVRQKSDQETEEYNKLLRDREELLDTLADLEKDRNELIKTEAEMSMLKQHVLSLEDSLDAQRDLNQSLREQLDETQMREADDDELSRRLGEAEEEINRLTQLLQKTDNTAQEQRVDYESRLRDLQKQLRKVNEESKKVKSNEDELDGANVQLTKLQAANMELQKKLHELKQEDKKIKQKYLDPEELKDRLGQLVKSIKAEKGGLERSNQGDRISQALLPFKEKLKKELEKSTKEVEKAKLAQAKVEEESKVMKAQLNQAQSTERPKVEIAVQTKMVDEDRRLAKLHDELEKLKEEMEKGQHKSVAPAAGRAFDPAEVGSHGGSEISSIPSSQWSERKQELYDTLNSEEQDLFDELQDEIEELKRLLGVRDKKQAAQKAAAASQTIGKLRDMISRRKGNEAGYPHKRQKQHSRNTAPENERIAEAADELARAESEIDDLHSQLRQKDKQLRAQIRHGDRSQHTIGEQQEELEQLRDILEEQKSEIIKLNQLLNKAVNGYRSPEDEEEIYRLRQGAAHVRSTVAHFAPRFRGAGIEPHSRNRERVHIDPSGPEGPAVQQHTSGHSNQTRDYQLHHVADQNRQIAATSLPFEASRAVFAPRAQHTVFSRDNNMAAVGGYPAQLGTTFHPQSPTEPVTFVPIAQTQSVGHGAQRNLHTPVAGSEINAQLSTPIAAVTPSSIPVMHSTPSEVKGILKSGADFDTEEELVCNVPEHHDLEDYINKLQAKLKTYKAKLLEGSDEDDRPDTDRKRVLFRDNEEIRAMKRLKIELEDRRAELEGLDLAIERQKTSLKSMKEAGEMVASERDAAQELLRTMKSANKSKEEQRRAFINGDGDFGVVHTSKKDFLTDEIGCLEETLAKRRAELREADELLYDCREDLKDARQEAKTVIDEYMAAKLGCVETAQDTEELERRARDAGIQLIKTGEQLEQVMQEVRHLQQTRHQEEKLLEDIQQVTGEKDERFQKLQAKRKESSSKSSQDGSVHSDTRPHSDQGSGDERKKKISSERRELDSLSKEISQRKADLKQITQEITQQRVQLETFDGDLNKLMENKRKELKDAEDRLNIVKDEQKTVDADLEKKRLKLDEVITNIEHEEAVLQNLAVTTSQQKLQLQRFEKTAQEQQETCNRNLARLRKEQTAMMENNLKIGTQINELSRTAEDTQKDIDGLVRQRCALVEGLSQLQDERSSMQKDQRLVEDNINQLKKTQTDLEESVRSDQSRLRELEADLAEVERDIDEARHEKSDLERQVSSLRTQGKEVKTELEHTEKVLREVENRTSLFHQTQAENQRVAQEENVALEAKIQTSEHGVQTRTKDMDALGEVRKKTEKETNSSMEQELMEVKDKSERERQDLEAIAQAHYNRANRLSDELNYLRAEYLELRRQLDCQSELTERDKKLETTLLELKDEIKTELSGGFHELDRSRNEALTELEQLYDQKDSLEGHLEHLKRSLHLIQIAGHPDDFSHSKLNLDSKEQFLLLQEILKKQLNRKMSEHAESIELQNQQSRDNLLKLQVKLQNVENALSLTSPATLHSDAEDVFHAPNAECDTNQRTQPGTSSHRYSHKRSLGSPGPSLIPERGPST